MSNVKDHSLWAALKSTKEFIESIDSAITNVGCVENPPARWDERLGMLTLSIENLNLESEIIEKLHDAVRGKNVEVWSRLAVEKLFTTALHSALGIFPPDQGNFASRLDREIQKLSNLLRAPLQNWQFIFPVLGLQIMDEPFVLGNVGFTHSNTDNLERLKNRVAEILKDSLLEEAEKPAFKKIQFESINKVFQNTTIATVSVNAAEKLAAKHMAHQDLLEVVDILNYFSIALYPADLRVSIRLPNEDRIGRHELLCFQSDQRYSLELTNQSPIQDFDLAEINADRSARIGLTRIKQIMSKPNKSELDRSVITAARIAGKAHFAGRREDAFLLFAIAIESLIVGGDEKTDLTYKLSTRCAHLLGDNLRSRSRVRDEIKKLYGIRSSIVHRGQSTFPESDLKNIRHYALSTIRAFLTHGELQDIEKKNQLADWFENRMLS